jgi:hypothetical protein
VYKLEEDMVSRFIVGKTLIEKASLLRIVFQFKKDQPQLELKE